MEAVQCERRGQRESGTVGEARPDVFSYRDYRQFLLDVIASRATRRKTYGRAEFAKALGFSSASGLNMIFSGQRELRSPYLDRCVRNLRLKSQERLYFEALVRAAGLAPAARRSFLREAEILTGTWKPPEQTEGLRLIDFMILQQILCLVHRPMSVTEIRSLFRYDIQEDEILVILDWMREHGYVEVVQGKFKAIRSVMTSQDEVPNVSLRKVHVDAARLAEQALESDPIENREFQTFHFTMDKKRLPELKHRLKALVLDVLREYETELDASTAVQMHFHLFEVINGNSACLKKERLT